MTSKRMFNTIKSIAIETKLLNLLSLENILYLAMKIGVNIIVSPRKMDNIAIQNQFPFVQRQHIPKSKHKLKYIESGNKINLCFFISLGRFVKVKDSSNEEATIQNQDNVPSIAKLHIKQGIKATMYEILKNKFQDMEKTLHFFA